MMECEREVCIGRCEIATYPESEDDNESTENCVEQRSLRLNVSKRRIRKFERRRGEIIDKK
ncbi:hypothetical protein NECAME_02574 [Necator americanus]|uniref:Uncharacterized protein n=1 Tax=Necator americanus TaxID=51031 RepID=W2TF17_NECAM|nr:hypothetical protein NECAME_02574 [Necator americanus]ETN79751.1 hypothetical protein NECAME_02574 [Necator americanus]